MSELLTHDIVSDLRVCLIDETRYWKEVPEEIDIIYGVFLYDASLNVHLCSLKASYEAYFLGHYWTAEDYNTLTDGDVTRLNEWVREGFVDEPKVQYYHGLDNLEKQKAVEIDGGDYLPEFDSENTTEVRANIKQVIEHLRPKWHTMAFEILHFKS